MRLDEAREVDCGDGRLWDSERIDRDLLQHQKGSSMGLGAGLSARAWLQMVLSGCTSLKASFSGYLRRVLSKSSDF